MDLWKGAESLIIKEEVVCKSECEVIIDVLEDSVDINPDITYPDVLSCSEVKENIQTQQMKRKQSRARTTMRTHTGERPYKCDQCSYSAKVLCALYRHKRVHTGERPYACQECTYRAAQPSHLVRHKMIHTGERPHSCSQCSYSASQMSHLVRHMSVHNNYRPFPCTECPYRAKRKSHLQKHLATHEKERKNNATCTRELRHIKRAQFNYAEDGYEYLTKVSKSCKFCTDEKLECKLDRKIKHADDEVNDDHLVADEHYHPSDFVQINMND
uniref:C2H2-type domain-containing protein n=1 Tax=Rhodnius prolixus TaxID=13249 RepID=T1HRJ6_RHOPR